jgi:hypothetical protein
MSIIDQPTAQIVTRRHPLALAAYAMVFTMGLIFVFSWFGTGQHTEDVFPHTSHLVIFLWKWEMVTGGGAALAALIGKPRVEEGWPDLADLLHLEGIGALVAGFGVSTYLVAILHLHGPSQSGPAIVVFGTIVLGCVFRGIQALREGRRLEHLAEFLSDGVDLP